MSVSSGSGGLPPGNVRLAPGGPPPWAPPACGASSCAAAPECPSPANGHRCAYSAGMSRIGILTDTSAVICA
ncbi:hypothetical protein, partial [Bacillus sp. 3255]|uniref:hypothetical protein n=1 Tax=Bacillus sp. 3255 TaxID=2817904 RepID=UPI00286A36E2